jgi:hypothetical protein
MKKSTALSLILVLAVTPVLAQNFTDEFNGTPADDFASSSADWDAVWSGDEWTTAMNSGGVSPKTDVFGPGEFGEPADAFENAIISGDDGWRDYSVEAGFYIADNDAIGLVFRYTSPDSFYLLAMSRDRMPSTGGVVEYLLAPEMRLYRIFEGEIEQILSPIPDDTYQLNPSSMQRLRIEVDGTAVRVWLGEGGEPIDTSLEPVVEIDDGEPAPVSGRAGLYAFAMGEGVAGTYFDKFQVRPLDSDDDGKSNDEELEAGTDPHDADSDDDGIPDGSEYDWLGDADSDELINALDWDSDNDELPDGLERGYTTPATDTDLKAGHFIADQDPLTTTDHLNPDTDSGGYSDGEEDLNRNGRYEYELGETDPNNPDDDGLYPDAGASDTDTDTDTGTDTDSDADTDTDTGGTDTNPEDAGQESKWGSLYGGPNCGCDTVPKLRMGRYLGLCMHRPYRKF